MTSIPCDENRKSFMFSDKDVLKIPCFSNCYLYTCRIRCGIRTFYMSTYFGIGGFFFCSRYHFDSSTYWALCRYIYSVTDEGYERTKGHYQWLEERNWILVHRQTYFKYILLYVYTNFFKLNWKIVHIVYKIMWWVVKKMINIFTFYIF